MEFIDATEKREADLNGYDGTIQGEQRHYEELREYAYSLSKEELRRLYLAALIQEEERRNRYW